MAMVVDCGGITGAAWAAETVSSSSLMSIYSSSDSSSEVC
jgi:hypothetical protein